MYRIPDETQGINQKNQLKKDEKKPLLGTTLGTCDISASFQGVRPYAFQSNIVKIFRNSSVKSGVRNCLRVPRKLGTYFDSKTQTTKPILSDVTVIKGRHKSRFGGLVRCGLVWDCNICAAKVTECERKELTGAMARSVLRGEGQALITLTCPHSYRQRLPVTLGRICAALRRWANYPEFTAIMNELGYFGRIRVLEAMFGRNGWHPHFHLLFFFEGLFVLDDGLYVALLRLWIRACVSVGLEAPNAHGLQIQNGSAAADYITTKYGSYIDDDQLFEREYAENSNRCWSLEHELVKGYMKTGRSKGSSSAFGLVGLHIAGEDPRAAGLFLEHSETMKGKTRMKYSKGLRSRLGLGPARTYQEIVDSNDDLSILIDRLHPDHLRKILANDVRDEFLDIHYHQGIDAAAAFVSGLAGKDYTGGKNYGK